MDHTLNLGSSTGRYQVICLVQYSDDGVPSIPSAYIAGVAMSTYTSVTIDRGVQTGYPPNYRYGRITIYHGDCGYTGSQLVSFSTSQVYYVAYSFTGVDHARVSKTGSGSGTTSCTRSWTASGSGTYSVVVADAWISDESIIIPDGASNTTVDLDGGFIGHESNSNTSVSSGFSWSDRGFCDGYKIVGILLDVAAETYYQIDPTGATVTAEGGTGTLLEGAILNPEGASVTAEGGEVELYGNGDDYFVDPLLRSGASDGTSWEDAFWSLADANDAVTADNSDRVFVKAGTFSNTDAVLNLKGGTSWYGGFSRTLRGTEAPMDTRRWITDATIVDMDGMYGSSTPWGCISIITPGVSQSDNVRIDGFHFKNCDNQLSSTAGYGGAIRCDSQDGWKILNCKFIDCNVATGHYGGAICLTGEGTLGTKHQVVNCHFEGCSSGAGGGMAIIGANAVLSQCYFNECSGGSGGGILVMDTTDTCEFYDCSFTGCWATNHGSAICAMDYDHTLSFHRCRAMLGETALSAVYVLRTSGSAVFEMLNSIIADSNYNGVQTNGVGYDNVRLINCTIANNDGYGIVSPGSIISDIFGVYNSIIWGNTVGQINGTLTCQYSDVEGGYSGTGNIDTDPHFIGDGNPEPYALSVVTDCVDGASSGVTGYEAVDITGFTRTGTPDIGAIEYFPTVIGCIDAGIYHVDMSSKNISHGTARPGMNFMFPFLLQESPKAFRETVDALDGRPKCYPLAFGSETERENTPAYLVEVWNPQESGYSINRIDSTLFGDPTWAEDFDESVQQLSFFASGSEHFGTLNTNSRGLEHTIYSEKRSLLFDLIKYSVVHRETYSISEVLKVYNVWVEGHAQVDRDWDDYVAQFLDTYASVSDADLPVSSGLIIEFCRLLNLLMWECRYPMSVPVFGIYWLSSPQGPII